MPCHPTWPCKQNVLFPALLTAKILISVINPWHTKTLLQSYFRRSDWPSAEHWPCRSLFHSSGTKTWGIPSPITQWYNTAVPKYSLSTITPKKISLSTITPKKVSLSTVTSPKKSLSNPINNRNLNACYGPLWSSKDLSQLNKQNFCTYNTK